MAASPRDGGDGGHGGLHSRLLEDFQASLATRLQDLQECILQDYSAALGRELDLQRQAAPRFGALAGELSTDAAPPRFDALAGELSADAVILSLGDERTYVSMANGTSMPGAGLADLPPPVDTVCAIDAIDSPKTMTACKVHPLDRWECLVQELLDGHQGSPDDKDLDLEISPLWLHRGGEADCLAPVATLTLQQRHSSTMEYVPDETYMDDDTLSCFVVHPQNTKVIAWGMFGMVIISYDMIMIPLIAFDIGQAMFFTLVSLVTLMYWTLDIPFQFFIGFHQAGAIEMRLGPIRQRYIKSWFFPDAVIVAMDVLFISWDVETWGDTEEGEGQGAAASASGSVDKADSHLRLFRLLRLLRLVRLVRIVKLATVVGRMLDSIQSEYVTSCVRLAQLVVTIMVLCHYIACAWYGLASWNESGELTWIQAHHLYDHDVLYHYWTSLHWALTQFTPATNNIAPQNTNERAFAVCIVFFAFISVSSFIGRVTAASSQLQAMHAERMQHEARIRSYIHRHNISRPLGDRVWACFRQTYKRQAVQMHKHDVDLVRQLPESLQICLHAETYMPSFKKSYYFREFAYLDQTLFVRVCHVALTEKVITASHDVFLESSECKHVLNVASGELLYFTPITETDVEAHAWISFMALFVVWAHAGQLVAKNNCVLVELNIARFQTIVSERGGPLFGCMKKFAIFLVGHVEMKHSKGEEVNDLPLEEDVVQELYDRSYKLSRAKVAKSTTRLMTNGSLSSHKSGV